MRGDAQEIRLGDIHHLAMVVDDLGSGMRAWSEVLGLSWSEPWTGPIPILVEGEKHEPIISFTLSREGPPHLELIQSTIHPVWQPMVGLHHTGFWTEDTESAVENLLVRGFTLEVMSPTADFAYLRSRDGARIELVNSRSIPDFQRWLDGGQL